MTDYYPSAENYMQVLPSVLDHDKNMHHLGETAARSFIWLWPNIDLPNIYKKIDSLPESVLDVLAKDFKVDWYDFDYGISAKRELIKSSFFVHRHLGTAQAVRSAISSIWPQSDIEEWFQYDGQPFWFRVILTANSDESIRINDLKRAVVFYKSMRSWLEDDRTIVRIICPIRIRTDTTGQNYHPRVAGTYPNTATHGEISRAIDHLQTGSDGQIYHPNLTGQTVTGTMPNTGTSGVIEGNSLAMHAGTSNMLFHPRVCGTPNSSLY